MRKLMPMLVVLAACATENNIRTVKNFRAAKARGDAAAQAYVAPDARVWFERKEGPGEPFGGGGGSWDHWDQYFHAKTTFTDWTEHDDGSVTATAHETNDFMRLLDWQATPYTVTYGFDGAGRIAEVLIKSLPGKTVNRLGDFKAWAAANHPDELAYLMPNGKLDPTGDRPERWRAILEEWRRGERPSRPGSQEFPPQD